MFAFVLSVLTIVPFAYHDNRMMIQCTIDGKGPFSLVLDTGSPDITITPETARVLGLRVRNNGSAPGAGNTSVPIGATRLSDFSVGSASLGSVDASVIDLSEIRNKVHFQRLDGIVGYPLLSRYVTYVNSDAGTVSLSDRLPNIPSAATVTKFHGVLPIVSATIEGISTSVIVDTGDRSSLTLFGPFAKHYGFFGRYPSRSNVVTGYGLGGPVYADVFTLPRLEVFGTQVNQVITRASRQKGGVFTSTVDGGSIGTGVLKRFNVVYDYAHTRIIAWPGKHYADPDIFIPLE